MSERLIVGYIAGVHGIRGAVKLKLHDPDSPSVFVGAEVVLMREARELGRYEIEAADDVPGKPGLVRVTLAGVDDRESAEALKGAVVEVPREELPPLEDDEFYLADTVGRAVVRRREDGSEQDVGRIVGLSTNGAQDLFEIDWRAPDGRHHVWLLPVLPIFVRDVGPERVLVDVPDGFLPDAFEAES